MRVAADDHLEPGGRWVNVKIVYIVQNVDRGGTGLCNRSYRQARRPGILIDIAPDCHQRRQSLQRVEDLRLSHISRVDDEIRALERAQSFLPQQSMSVRNQSD